MHLCSFTMFLFTSCLRRRRVMNMLGSIESPLFKKSVQIKNYLFQGICSSNQLKHIHAALLRHGLDQDNYFINKVLGFSFDFGNITYPRLIFHQIQQPNIFLWNTMVRGLVCHDCFDEALEFYNSMRGQGFLPNSFTFPFVLKACSRVMDICLGLKTHCLLLKTGFDDQVFVKTSLLALYAKCGYLDYAYKVFDEIPEKNIVSWTAIITGYLDEKKYKEVIGLFRKLLGDGLKPDSFTLVRVLTACAQAGDLKTGEWIDEYITETGIVRNKFVSTSLVDLYVKCGDMKKAQCIFDGMYERDIVCWSSMIQGYASNGHPKEALDFFFKMLNEDLMPDRYAMVGVLSACTSLGALDLGEWASSLMDRHEFYANPVLGTALIEMYAKCGSAAKAWEIFKGIKKKDRVVWNAAIFGLAMTGHVKTSFGVFNQSEKVGMLPDGNTFMALLCGCTHAGLVDEGRRFFNSMNRVFSLTPTIEHYGCMVDLLGRAGLLNEARQLIKSMPIKANAVVWGALLSGCRLHKNIDLAEHVLKKLIELEPQNSGNYVLLSNIYSASHKWDAAAETWKTMSGKGMTKIPAFSWIEVGGVVHEFLVADKSHPLSNEIYSRLDEITMRLKDVGVASTDYVLFDIED